MTPQEQQMLQGLTDRINQSQLQEKDADAEQYIQQALGRNPDALYIMAQTILVQQYGMEQAQKQIADLRARLDQARQHTQEPKHATSFLGNLLGFGAESSREGPPPPPAQQRPAQPQYAVAPGYGAGPGYAVSPGYGAPPAGYPMAAPAQGGGFLRSAMQTAAGVAAGAFAFEGIESLMHGFGHASGYGTEFGGQGLGASGSIGGMGGERPETVNNYYGDATAHEPGGDVSSLGDVGGFHDASAVTDDSTDSGTSADALSGTTDSDYSSNEDDSMLADDMSGSDQDPGDAFDSGGDDLGNGDSGGDFDSGGGDDGGGGF